MHLIKPSQISGEILTLFDETDEKIIIVSPYCDFQKWYKLVSKLKSLQARNIEIEFYVRKGEAKTIQEVEQVGIEPITINNLHCKLYMNEKIAIVSSMNLLLSSEIHSLDIAYKTTTTEEYNELFDFYKRYIRQNENLTLDKTDLFEAISEEFEKIRIYENDGEFVFKTRINTYRCFIWNKKSGKTSLNYLRISGILSYKEFEYSKKISNEIEKKTGIKIEYIEGGKGCYDAIWGTSIETMETNSINNLSKKDIPLITKNIISFIKEIEDLKKAIFKPQ